MIPAFDKDGRLPPGIHHTDWQEFTGRFGSTPYRHSIMLGLNMALEALRRAQCEMVYIDGSFVTAKDLPGDFDACWSTIGVDFQLLDPIFFDFNNGRAAQKSRFLGEFFPAEWSEGISGLTFLEFFQNDKGTGDAKGIIALDLRRLP